MKPRIEILNEKKLIGIKLSMSLAEFKIAELWKSFMTRRNEIVNKHSNDLISMTIYSPNHFLTFDLNNKFEKWAAIEVNDFDTIPTQMETFVLKSGLYAVFNHKGLSSDNSIFRFIFELWLPSSGFVLDNRPHFEILTDNYRSNDPNSEEEIWIPVKSI